LQQGHIQVDADSDEYEYVRMRRFPLAIAQSLDQALGLDLFEPGSTKGRTQPRAAPDWSDASSHDPGISLLELLAYAADQLSTYADEVAVEARVHARRRTAVAAGAGILVLAWWCRRSRA
jgi:hypothetical protein